MVFLDGTVLDTADPTSRQAFLKVRPAFLPFCCSQTRAAHRHESRHCAALKYTDGAAKTRQAGSFLA